MRRTIQSMAIMVAMILCIVTCASSLEMPPGITVFEVDSFTYRASFLLTDGTEALLLRGRFEVFYLYRHHHPTVSEHVMSVTLGFYYGKTILGRQLLTNVTVDSLSFLPQWHDSAGYAHTDQTTSPHCLKSMVHLPMVLWWVGAESSMTNQFLVTFRISGVFWYFAA